LAHRETLHCLWDSGKPRQYPKKSNLSPGRSWVLGRSYANFVELRKGEVRILGILGSWPGIHREFIAPC
jgi:hypothetical protein